MRVQPRVPGLPGTGPRRSTRAWSRPHGDPDGRGQQLRRDRAGCATSSGHRRARTRRRGRTATTVRTRDRPRAGVRPTRSRSRGRSTSSVDSAFSGTTTSSRTPSWPQPSTTASSTTRTCSAYLRPRSKRSVDARPGQLDRGDRTRAERALRSRALDVSAAWLRCSYSALVRARRGDPDAGAVDKARALSASRPKSSARSRPWPRRGQKSRWLEGRTSAVAARDRRASLA